jgi:Secretion system C-terminal sorting domain
MFKKNTFSAILFLFSIHALCGQTTVSGGIFSSTTWLKSKSPYIVTSNLIVFDDVVLTIQAGVVVKFEDNTSLELRNGKLVALGTARDSIVFTSKNTSPYRGIWKGILVIGTTMQTGQDNQIQMAYCQGLYADLFLNLDIAYHTPYTFNNCSFGYNNTVFYDGLESVRINNSTFYNNDIGIEAGYAYTVRNSLFKDNKIGAKAVARLDSCTFINNTVYALLPYGITTNNTFLKNKIAVGESYFNSVNNTFTGNIIKGNEVGVEMLTYFNGFIDFSNNIICDNRLYNVKRINNNNGNNNVADLSRNCWCTHDSIAIESKILDAKDDVNLGLILISPISNNCVETISSIQNKENDPNIVVYPNPAYEEVTVSCKNLTPQYLTLLDVNGKVLLRKKGETSSTIFDLSDYPSGIYIIKINTINSFFVKRIVKN